MHQVPPELAGHPDRLKWNARYSGFTPSFTPHQLAEEALALPMPDGPVLELACRNRGRRIRGRARPAGRRGTPPGA